MPFSGPPVGPKSTAEQEYDHLTVELRESTYSSCIGWIIKQRMVLETDEGIQQMNSDLGGLFVTGPIVYQKG